jgi:hypothetical protein
VFPCARVCVCVCVYAQPPFPSPVGSFNGLRRARAISASVRCSEGFFAPAFSRRLPFRASRHAAAPAPWRRGCAPARTRRARPSHPRRRNLRTRSAWRTSEPRSRTTRRPATPCAPSRSCGARVHTRPLPASQRRSAAAPQRRSVAARLICTRPRFRAPPSGFSRVCARVAPATHPPHARTHARSEDAKSLAAALEKYRRAVEASVEGGLLELGLKGFSAALVNVASRDSVKVRACRLLLRARRGAVLRLRLGCARTAGAGETGPALRCVRACVCVRACTCKTLADAHRCGARSVDATPTRAAGAQHGRCVPLRAAHTRATPPAVPPRACPASFPPLTCAIHPWLAVVLFCSVGCAHADLELRANDPMTDLKEAAIALGHVYRRAGDARLRLAAKMTTARPLRQWSELCLCAFRSVSLCVLTPPAPPLPAPRTRARVVSVVAGE